MVDVSTVGIVPVSKNDRRWKHLAESIHGWNSAGVKMVGVENV